jgi:hypothetical protein
VDGGEELIPLSLYGYFAVLAADRRELQIALRPRKNCHPRLCIARESQYRLAGGKTKHWPLAAQNGSPENTAR